MVLLVMFGSISISNQHMNPRASRRCIGYIRKHLSQPRANFEVVSEDISFLLMNVIFSESKDATASRGGAGHWRVGAIEGIGWILG